MPKEEDFTLDELQQKLRDVYDKIEKVATKAAFVEEVEANGLLDQRVKTYFKQLLFVDELRDKYKVVVDDEEE